MLLPILSLCVGAIVKAVSAYALVGNAQIAALGAPMSTLLSNAAVLILNFIFVSRTVAGKTGMLSELPKPFFASLVAMVSSYTVFLPLVRANVGQTVAFIIAFGVAVAVYLVLAVALGVVSKDDITVFKRTTKVK